MAGARDTGTFEESRIRGWAFHRGVGPLSPPPSSPGGVTPLIHDDPIPIAALQHWCYCPRQCGLIHLEQAFDDNLFTLRGHAVHARVDQPGVETAKGVRVERSLPIWHDALGLNGKADVVEFADGGAPYPVEYKHGSRHKAASIAACDDLQLAAQAICLEEMTGRPVSEGAIFYASSKRRRIVPITTELRTRVAAATAAVREMLRGERLPPPLTGDRATERCRGCSLRDRCQPKAAADKLSLAREQLFDPDA
jgi:CRISPR-associated exonuclease Cas4